MGLAERFGERIAPRRDRHPMNMIRHQTPAQHRHLAACALDSQRFEITPAVIVIQENVLAVIASLGDVMRRGDRHHPRLSGHGTVRC